MDRWSKHLWYASALRGQVWTRELVSTLKLTDGTAQEIADLSVARCTQVLRRPGKTIGNFKDIDRTALEREFPFKTFTVADFPELYVDHVGRRIGQGVGDVQKVPLTWIGKSGGFWTYAASEILAPGSVVQAVYRGTEPTKGALVNPTEYAVSSAVGASTGVQVLTIKFTREQLDKSGRPYVIEADLQLPGSTRPADEAARILALYGIAVDASFAAAAAADAAAGIFVSAYYGGLERGRRGDAIVNDLLAIARAWLTQTTTAAWGLVQDVARAAVATYDVSNDLIELEQFGDGEKPKTLMVNYGPRSSADMGTDDYVGHLPADIAGGISGDKRIDYRYVRDHVVADKLRSYWKKRLSTLEEATGTIYAVQHAEGSRISVTDTTGANWMGTKDLIAVGISRPADRNQFKWRKYDADVYVYTAGTDLPAAATNGYSPDLSFTRPAQPLAVSIIGSGTTVQEDGTIVAYARVRATPPAANWERLVARIRNTSTDEGYQADLALNGGNYEATITGMHPNVGHEFLALAFNANGMDGDPTPVVPFTSANVNTDPSAPTSLQVLTQGATVTADGTMTSFATIRAVPPAIYFKRLVAQVTNTVSGEAYQIELVLNAGNYEAQITGLHPGVAHNVIAWAVNASNSPGTRTSPVAFTSATFSTAPSVPTLLQVVSTGTTVDQNGRVLADALIRAVPPAQYFKKMMAQVKDTTTGAVRQAEMLLNAGNYEVRFYGLMPNRNHDVVAWAINASGDNGSITAPVSFTSATSPAVPSAPATAAVSQLLTFEVQYSWSKVTPAAGAPPIDYYVLEENLNGGGFTELARGDFREYKRGGLATGATAQIRVKCGDRHNESGYATSGVFTTAKTINDSYILSQGVGGGSIANSSINRGHGNTGTNSMSSTVLTGFTTGFAMDIFTFFPAIYGDGTQLVNLMVFQSDLGNDQGLFAVYNNTGATHTIGVRYRNFLP